ncbi:MAG: DUF4388 domain-containing protein [Myxococcales bacterium]|nr:DUF4388 domain-containing protein [Myxococcales bacterium]
MGGFSGDLSVMPLSDIVIWLANRGVSGSLRVERGGIEKTFDLMEGHAVRASSNDPREYFGQFLVHYGLLTEDQLQRAFQTQNETHVLLGRILVMIGIVPEEQVIQTLRVKMAETMLDAFRWKEGRFELQTGDSGEERPQIEMAIPLLEIHTEGLARSEMWARYNRIFPDRRWYLSVNEEAVAAKAQPDTLPGKVLALARHGLSIEAITLDLHATDYQMASRLLELHRDGAVIASEPSASLIPMTNGALRAHVDRARAAMEAEHYSAAFRYVDEAVDFSGSDDELLEIREELDTRARQAGSGNLDRSSIPRRVGEIADSELRKLSAKQRYVMARIDGRRTIEAIIQVSPMRDDEAMEILRQFLADRLICLP